MRLTEVQRRDLARVHDAYLTGALKNRPVNIDRVKQKTIFVRPIGIKIFHPIRCFKILHEISRQLDAKFNLATGYFPICGRSSRNVLVIPIIHQLINILLQSIHVKLSVFKSLMFFARLTLAVGEFFTQNLSCLEERL